MTNTQIVVLSTCIAGIFIGFVMWVVLFLRSRTDKDIVVKWWKDSEGKDK